MLRNNSETRWPHGVISGGIVIDLLECLSHTTQKTDYAFVLWLQSHYIEPFGRIERLDGLVVTQEEDCAILYHAYERYIDIQGEGTRAHKLFVPGLEPIQLISITGVERLPEEPRNTEYKKWRASDMYYKNGLEVKRKAKFESRWTDKNRWDRMIWSVPSAKKSLIVTGIGDTIEATVELDMNMGEWLKVEKPLSDGTAYVEGMPSPRTGTPATTMSHTLSPETAKSGSSHTLSLDATLHIAQELSSPLTAAPDSTKLDIVGKEAEKHRVEHARNMRLRSIRRTKVREQNG